MKKSAHWLLMLPPSLRERRLLCAPSLPRNWCKFPQPRKQGRPGPTHQRSHRRTLTCRVPWWSSPCKQPPHQRSLPEHQRHPLWWRRPRFPRLRPPPPRCLRCRAVRLHRSPHQPLHCNPGRKILATSRSDTLQACLLFPNPAPPSHRPPPSPASFKHPVSRGGWRAGCTKAF